MKQHDRFTKKDAVMKVVSVDRKSAVLSRSSLACLTSVPTVNLTAGCLHRCVYCYTRGYANHPGEARIELYANTLAKIKKELPRKRKKPNAVYFSPSSDLSQPVPEVLDMAFEVIAHLLEANVGVSFVTKGDIPERHIELLASRSELVHAQIGLITTDQDILGEFEPGAAAADVRLRQAKQLVDAGIAVQFRLDPILPNLTDDESTLDSLCQAIQATGVCQIAASVLFLRPAVRGAIRRNVKNDAIRDRLLAQFTTQTRLRIHAQNSSVIALPVEHRQEIYDRVRRVAKAYSLDVFTCSCKNPDIVGGACQIAGSAPLNSRRVVSQRTLFE